MAVRYSYDDTEALKRTITDAIDLIDPRERPIIAYFGLDGSPSKFNVVNWPGRKVEWLNDSLIGNETTTDAGWATDWTTLSVTKSALFKVGDILEVTGDVSGTEEVNYVRVEGITSASDDLTVDPNYDGSNPTGEVDSGAKVRLIGSARAEGADADYARELTDVSAAYNYTQIFQDDLSITRTADKLLQYGKSGEWDYQAAKKLPELTRQMELTFYHGVRAEDSSNNHRSMGGIEAFISSNTTDVSGDLTTKALHDLAQDCWEEGGNPNLIVCNAWQKRRLSSLFEGFVRTTRDESTGGVQIDTIATEFGELDILMDRFAPTDKLYVLEAAYIGFLAFDPFFWEKLAKTGDAEKGQVVGEYTLVVKNEEAHGYLENLSTS